MKIWQRENIPFYGIPFAVPRSALGWVGGVGWHFNIYDSRINFMLS